MKNKSPFLNVGLSSLLVVFFSLCLVVFAALSLASANSSRSLSLKLAQRKTDYYAACTKAEAVLEQVDTLLAQQGQEADFSPLGVIRREDCLTFEIPVDETQVLTVTLRLVTAGNGNYEIEAWETAAVENPVPQETLPLMPVGGN